MNASNISFSRAGESAIFCRIADSISPETSQYVIGLHKLISSSKPSWLIESVPSYTGLMLYFNLLRASLDNIEKEINALYDTVKSESSLNNCRLLIVPVCYDRIFAPDLDIVSQGAGLNYKETIELHTSVVYLVNMLGFTPGFPYLGGLNSSLSTPRKKEPRLNIKAGSVGIAGDQTGIYPLESPGGWQIIGRTPLRLYCQDQPDPFLFKAGDNVRFQAISLNQYFELGEAIRLGKYKPEIIQDYERS